MVTFGRGGRGRTRGSSSRERGSGSKNGLTGAATGAQWLHPHESPPLDSLNGIARTDSGSKMRGASLKQASSPSPRSWRRQRRCNSSHILAISHHLSPQHARPGPSAGRQSGAKALCWPLGEQLPRRLVQHGRQQFHSKPSATPASFRTGHVDVGVGLGVGCCSFASIVAGRTRTQTTTSYLLFSCPTALSPVPTGVLVLKLETPSQAQVSCG